jgi:hypothetical protein
MSDWIFPEAKAAMDAMKRRQWQQEPLQQEEVLPVVKVPLHNYVLIDAALWQEDAYIAKQHGTLYRSLYCGKPAVELINVAPYLFCVPENNDFEKWVNGKVEKSPVERRLLRIASSLDMEGLRRHLRRFLRMKKQAGGYMYSRFYDPYMANCFLPNLTQPQLNEFFVSVECLITEDVRINERRIFSLSPSKELQIKYEAIYHVDNK